MLETTGRLASIPFLYHFGIFQPKTTGCRQRPSNGTWRKCKQVLFISAGFALSTNRRAVHALMKHRGFLEIHWALLINFAIRNVPNVLSSPGLHVIQCIQQTRESRASSHIRIARSIQMMIKPLQSCLLCLSTPEFICRRRDLTSNSIVL